MFRTLLMLVALVFVQGTFATERFDLNFNNARYPRGGMLPIKQMIRQYFPGIQIDSYRLVEVVVIAKSIYSYGNVRLSVGPNYSPTYPIRGGGDPNMSTFDRVRIQSPSWEIGSEWYVELGGDIILNKVAIFAEYQYNPYPPYPPGPQPTPYPPNPPPTPTPSPYERVVDVYRYINTDLSDNFQSSTLLPWDNREGYNYVGISFQLFTDGGYWKSPLFRCWNEREDDSFLSADPYCEGQRSEGVIGYVYNQKVEQAQRQIFRCYSPTLEDRFTTTDVNECKRAAEAGADYRVEGPQGWVP